MNNEYLVETARSFKYWLNIKSPRDERILEALRKIDRKEFLPEFAHSEAYVDEPVRIGYEATCSQPSLVALMADMLELYDGANVLEIGMGCAYSTALTASLIGNGKLTTIEIVPELTSLGRHNLEKHFGTLSKKIEILEGDGSIGFPPNAPYQRIYLTASVDAATFQPDILLSQLDDGGILLYPERFTESLFLDRKVNGKVKEDYYRGIVFVPLKGKNK